MTDIVKNEQIADTLEAISRAIQELANKIESGCDDESVKEYSKAVYRMTRAYAIISNTR